MTYSPKKFEVAISNGLGGDTFTRFVTDGHTHGRTDFDTILIYPFFLKKKAGITKDVYIHTLMHILMSNYKGQFNCDLLWF